MKEIYLAGGCLCGTQKFFDQFDGMVETEVGYANGNYLNPSYNEVCRNNTGHAETVRIEENKQGKEQRPCLIFISEKKKI